MRLSEVSRAYGAPMGRPEHYRPDRKKPIRLIVHHCPFVDGDYDEGGAYWGAGTPLWRAVEIEGDTEFFVRATDWHDAHDQVYAQYPNAEIVDTPRERWFEEFVMAYIECALWSSTQLNCDDNLEGELLAPCTETQMREDCKDFVEANELVLVDAMRREGYDAEYAGHDFWLTRNHHGAGYWDRGLGAVGRKLTEAAHVYGEASLYLGDDGLVYQG
jgi:hypothetical protein